MNTRTDVDVSLLRLVEYRLYFELYPAVLGGSSSILLRNQHLQRFRLEALRRADLHFERADRYQLMHRGTPSARAGKIHHVQDQPARLLVELAIDQAATGYLQRQIAPRGPSDQVGQEVAVVGQIVDGESPVDVGGQIGYTTAV
jgi:hypothetical protein